MLGHQIESAIKGQALEILQSQGGVMLAILSAADGRAGLRTSEDVSDLVDLAYQLAAYLVTEFPDDKRR